MALSNWLCTQNTRNMLVKIVYPGGRIELHDRPILAAEIMQQNPRCCVTYPDVFRHPWAVVSPDTVLTLGQKFYVVPIGTIKKLRRLSSGNYNSPNRHVPAPLSLAPRDQPTPENDKGACWASLSLNTSKKLDSESDVSSSVSTTILTKNVERDQGLLDDGCFKCLIGRVKPKAGLATTDGMSCRMDDELELNRKGSKEYYSRKEMEGSPKRKMKNTTPRSHVYYWQPSLESITEE